MEDSVTDSSPSTITAWTLISAAQGQGKEASAALGELLTQFRSFITWTIAKLGPPPGKDLAELYQDYAFVFIRSELVLGLEKHGSLKGFLKTSLGFFVRSEWTAWRKRQQREVRDDWEPYGSSVEADIDAAYLATLVTKAIELARARTPNPARFAQLVRFLPGPACDPVPQSPLAAELGLTRNALAAAIHEERQRYQRCFDEVVLATLDLGEDAGNPVRRSQRLEAEKKALLALLEPPPAEATRAPEREPD